MCPGHGWCGHGGPSIGPTACALAIRRCVLWKRQEGTPGGGALRPCEGRLRSGARPPPAGRHRVGCWGPPPACSGRRRADVGGQHCPFGLHALPKAACRGGGGWLSREGAGFHHCEGRPVLGAVPLPARGGRPGPVAVCPRQGWCAHGGPSTGPTACVLASRRDALWGWRDGVPGGGDLRPCEELLRPRARPTPAARPQGGLSWSATHLLRVRVCGRGGPALSLWPAFPTGGCMPRGWWEAVPGGWLSTVVRGVRC